MVVVGIKNLTIRSSAPLVMKKLRSGLGSSERERIGWIWDFDWYMVFHCDDGADGEANAEEGEGVWGTSEKIETDPSSYPDITVRHLVPGCKNSSRHIIMPGLFGPGEGML